MNLMKHYPFPSGFPLLQKQGHFSIKKTPFAKGELGTHIDRYRSLIMPLRFVRQAVANNTAQSLVLIVEFGARCGRRLAAPRSE